MGRRKIIRAEKDGTPVETEEFLPELRTVVWTKRGAETGAFSEHGQHEEGEHVETAHADLLIANGFAEALT